MSKPLTPFVYPGITQEVARGGAQGMEVVDGRTDITGAYSSI